jgi:phosphotriesterase-related protein
MQQHEASAGSTGLKVHTVLGPRPLDTLGATLFHEHLRIAMPWVPAEQIAAERPPAVDRATRQLQQLSAIGVTTIIDPCPIDLARDPLLMAEAARGSGVTVICATGLYTEDAALPEPYRSMGIDDLTELYLRELEAGIGDTDIRAGVLKCATSDGRITPAEERALRAAARASKRAGVPIITHTSGGTMGPEQADLFLAEGIAPEAVVIGHSDSRLDLEYHRGLFARGVFVGFDRIGNDGFAADEQRLDMLTTLINEGFGPQIMLSQDRAAWVFRPSPGLGGAAEARPMSDGQREKFRLGFTYLHRQFMPALLDRGVEAGAIAGLFEENPRRLFQAAAAQ